jgi:hypothetical protein
VPGLLEELPLCIPPQTFEISRWRGEPIEKWEHLDMTIAWRQYQEDAASHFRSLGFVAKVETKLRGARSLHSVDIFVTFTVGGVVTRWIVECKCWRSPVKKLHVAALSEISKDVGADRAFILSEVGFQPGAISAARCTNISLTSLEDLRTEALSDLRKVRSQALLCQKAILEKRLRQFLYNERGETPTLRLVDLGLVTNNLGDCYSIDLAIQQLTTGQSPLWMTGSTSRANAIYHNPDRFLDALVNFANRIERNAVNLDKKADRRRRSIARQVKSFLKNLTILLNVAEHALLSPFDNDAAIDVSRTRCAKAMQRVGDGAMALRPHLLSTLGLELQTLMRLLIDTVYPKLVKNSIPEDEWRTCRVAVEAKREHLNAELDRAILMAETVRSSSSNGS